MVEASADSFAVPGSEVPVGTRWPWDARDWRSCLSGLCATSPAVPGAGTSTSARPRGTSSPVGRPVTLVRSNRTGGGRRDRTSPPTGEGCGSSARRVRSCFFVRRGPAGLRAPRRAGGPAGDLRGGGPHRFPHDLGLQARAAAGGGSSRWKPTRWTRPSAAPGASSSRAPRRRVRRRRHRTSRVLGVRRWVRDDSETFWVRYPRDVTGRELDLAMTGARPRLRLLGACAPSPGAGSC